MILLVRPCERYLFHDSNQSSLFTDGTDGGMSKKHNRPKKIDKDKLKSKREKGKESGVSRGIDFQYVSNIINFDFPLDTDSYVHRVSLRCDYI